MKRIEHNKEQAGLVSIVSVMLITLIITVITLSLASLTRRSLRQSLDEQLSTQAQYAAESGINDAIKKIESGLNTDVTSCQQTGSSTGKGALFPDNTLSGADNVRYTCVLISRTSNEIVTDVKRDGVKSYELTPESGAISSLTFTWRNTNNDMPETTNCISSSGCLTNAGSWGRRLGLLRIRLVSGDTLSQENFSKFIDVVGYPGTIDGSNENTISGVTFPANYFTASKCVEGSCSLVINNLSQPGRTKYFMQAYSYYKDLNLTVTGAKVGGGGGVVFTGAQATIDVTGAARDVVKRVQVRVPISNSVSESNYSSLPPFTLGVGDKLCKRFSTNSSSTTDEVPDTCPAFGD